MVACGVACLVHTTTGSHHSRAAKKWSRRRPSTWQERSLWRLCLTKVGCRTFWVHRCAHVYAERLSTCRLCKPMHRVGMPIFIFASKPAMQQTIHPHTTPHTHAHAHNSLSLTNMHHAERQSEEWRSMGTQQPDGMWPATRQTHRTGVDNRVQTGSQSQRAAASALYTHSYGTAYLSPPLARIISPAFSLSLARPLSLACTRSVSRSPAFHFLTRSLFFHLSRVRSLAPLLSRSCTRALWLALCCRKHPLDLARASALRCQTFVCACVCASMCVYPYTTTYTCIRTPLV